MGKENHVTDQSQTPDLSAIKDRQQKTWTSGNYARIGNTLVIMGELLCEAVNVHAGDKVLDVATGSGNTAISAARRFCNTTGIDYVPELIEHARKRAEVEGMEVTFDVGDAEDLPYPDASFDVVLSTLGVMFAPDQEKVAEELLRTCRPGGKIGLANWTPDGFIGNMFRTLGKHVPPPPGIKPPPLWGTEERLRELLGEGVASLEVTQRSYMFRYPSTEHFVEYFRSYYGPTLKAFESLDLDRQEALAEDLEELLERWNISGDATIIVPSDYLEVVAVRR
jgi:ubiquinone/menaquinone biosynthesis C-methylase UbiE